LILSILPIKKSRIFARQQQIDTTNFVIIWWNVFLKANNQKTGGVLVNSLE
jgi:hypothetical protein